MKKKIGVMLLIGIILGSCITSFAGKFVPDYQLRYTNYPEGVSVYVDPYTGVNYLIWSDMRQGGICPRYNSDGELYITDVGQYD